MDPRVEPEDDGEEAIVSAGNGQQRRAWYHPLPCRASPPQGGRLAGACSQPSIESTTFRGGSLEAGIMPLVISPPVGEMPGRAEGGLLRQISHLRQSYSQIGLFSSPPIKPMPTIPPSRFGYTGRHNRRDGTGDLTNRRYASGSSGAAQKMVSLSPQGGACVCRTQPGMAFRKDVRPYRRRGTGVARKNTPNGARRVSPKLNLYEAPDVSRPIIGLSPGMKIIMIAKGVMCPSLSSGLTRGQGRTPSAMICLDSGGISCHSARHET
ncbi:Hypothetical protein RG540_CH40580 [Neorhizobium galegae bv. orientalis str. HAMBI 540]|uniref:Uncharacterized protein n=1 Tax=Neorhizobium galegae bv. orientalis str. HAMBI 540 TaxID=1028800 RepID=A0A068SV77_NEOGA|nr:Hypothetical protein RG540_CH40580 [Neorhizobium galegae bv. orientalis str. HAMBI 540]